MKNLDDNQLAKKAREYDNINNDGGEGYNPYRDEIDRRGFEYEKNRPKSLQEQKNAVYRRLNVVDCSIARECGTYDPEEVDALKSKLAAIEKKEAEAFAAEWTLAETQRRRAGWNDFVRSLMDSEGKIKNTRAIYARQAKQGWTMDDLKKAVKHHNL